MRTFPRSPWRPLALVLIGLILIGWRISKWIPPRHVYDRAQVIPDRPEMLANINLAVLRQRYGVDARFVLLDNDSIADLASYALNALRRYRVGDSEGGRGIVVVLNYATRQMRMEVGPHLEGVFTDGFTGYVLRTHMGRFTDRDAAELGVRSLFHLLLWRAEEALAGNEWDATALEHVRDSVRLATGGGASAGMVERAPVGARPRLRSRVRASLGAQPTLEAAYDAYLRWTLCEPYDGRVDLFTPTSQIALDRTPYTRPFLDIEFLKYSGRPHRFVVHDSLALLYVTDSPIVPPSLLRRSPAGWQFDPDADWRHFIQLPRSGFTWGWEPSSDQYTQAFADLFQQIDGVARLKDGDNRRLPMRKTQWD
jgi:TLP18.3/Psb32/MOLO-1 phosphatase superfamily protein